MGIKREYEMMKMIWGGLAVFVLVMNGSQRAYAQDVTLTSDREKLGYAIGLDIGQSVEKLGADIDQQALTAGILDRLNHRETKMSKQEAARVRQAFFTKRAEKQAEERRKAGEKNMQEGKAFLARNKKRKGVTTTGSGLQYEVIAMGDGARPRATDTVEVHYRGTLLDGTEFDSSYRRGQPVSFPLNAVIRGWTEGVQLMPVGSKFRFFIPPELAYGARGAGAAIGPHATLIFEVELLDIKG